MVTLFVSPKPLKWLACPLLKEALWSITPLVQLKPKDPRTCLSICEGFAAISPSIEDKVYIKAQWSHALNMKVFGRNVGYLYVVKDLEPCGT